MAVVLNTQITLNPGNQIAHLADWTGLVSGTEYVITGTFIPANTRFVFHGVSDIALSRPPVGVPAPNTEVPCTISDVPQPATASPPAAYPYILNDRIVASNLNAAFNLNPGTTPPHGNGGNSGQFKIWADVSLSPHVLRLCTRPGGAQNGYVAGDWADLFTVDPASGGIKVTWTGQVNTPGTGGGYLPLNGGRLSNTLAVGVNTARPSDAADYNIFTGHITTTWVGFNLYNSVTVWRRYADGMGGIFNFSKDDGYYRWYGAPTGAIGSVASTLVQIASLNSQTGDFVAGRDINATRNVGAVGLYAGSLVNSGNLVNAAQYQINGVMWGYQNDGDTRTLNDTVGQWCFLYRAGAAENYYANNVHRIVTRNNGLALATISSGNFTVHTNLYVAGESRINGWFYVGGSTTSGNPGGTIGGRIYAGDVIVSWRNDDLALWAPNGGCTVATAFVSSRAGLAFYAPSGSSSIGGQAASGSVATGQINAGNIYCNDTTAYGQLFSSNSIFAFTSGLGGYDGHGLTKIGGNPCVTLQTNCYLIFQTATGHAWWQAGPDPVWVMTGGICYNNLGLVGGRGPYADVSDIRTKNADTIEPATAGLAEVLALKPVTFERLSVGEDAPFTMPPTTRELGFIAQDVAEVFPSAVGEIPMQDGPAMTVLMTPIIAAMANGFRELDNRLKALEGA